MPEIIRSELTEIGQVIDALEDVEGFLNNISLGDLGVYDVNGDQLGTIKWDTDKFYFEP